jgi:hypothetical protein
MTRISNDFSTVPERYRDDVKTIVESCYRQGLIVAPHEAYSAWCEYSDSMAAGWMGVPTSYDDGESPWKCTLDDCDREITVIVENYGKRNYDR